MSMWPKPAVSVAVFRQGDVLLVRRANQPNRGVWALPGGHIEPGEEVRQAAMREVGEEAGIAIRLTGLVDVVDVVQRAADGEVLAHYVLSVFAALWQSGEVRAASDSTEAEWFAADRLSRVRLADGTEAAIERARAVTAHGFVRSL